MQPETPVSDAFRLVPSQKSALRKLGITTVRDLLYHFPARYETAGMAGHAGHLVPGTKVTLYGTFSSLKAKKLWKSRRTATDGYFEDGSGKVKAMWFNQPYIASYLKEGQVYKVTATVGGTADKPYLANPQTEVSSMEAAEESGSLFVNPEESPAPEASPTLFAIYPESVGITSLWFQHALKRIFAAGIHTMLIEPLPANILRTYHLPDLASALIYIHTPEKREHSEAARKRFAFEEIFLLQIIRARERNENAQSAAFGIVDAQERAQRFLASSPFPPTNAQRRAITDIVHDLEQSHPMARLLEGDVGSGKTLVAAAASYSVVTARPQGRESGTLQVAYMAPTEILAQQHFQSFIEYFKDLPINIALITGSGCKKFPSKSARGKATDISRSQLLKWVESGEIAMLVGTHALIQKSVQFRHLALVIVDEQHRFGTRQRRALAQKNTSAKIPASPHFLSMTATPIPRTLALTIYGDLDLSVLDELPPGRAKITTRLVKKNERASAYDTLRDELKKGRQGYVICPRIDEPDPKKLNAVQAKSVKVEAERLQKDLFPEYRIGILHGAMTPKEKDAVMVAFTTHKIDILVATSVVEVGVNVPNATVILIEGAERFGLAQLHQLRGRVMRSSHPPYCFLLPESSGVESLKRLKALEKSSDGFELAEADLRNRGAGDLYGRKQWGVTDVGMEALSNPRLIEAARSEALALVTRDALLTTAPELNRRVEMISRAFHTE